MGLGSRRGRAPRQPVHRVSFLGHELAEYALGLALVGVGLHLSGRSEYELVAAGGALLLLGLFSKGRLGALGMLGRGVHRLIDVAIALGLACSPLIAPGALGVGSVVIAEGLAVGLGWIVWHTDYVEPPSATPSPSGGQVGGVARAARIGARRLGLVAGVSRRVARERRSSRPTGSA